MKLEIILSVDAMNEKGARLFANAIKKKLTKIGLEYSVLAHPTLNNPYILISPTSLPSKYKDHILQLDQFTTADVIEDLIKASGVKEVTIFGFGDVVGKPLTRRLDFCDVEYNIVRSNTIQDDIDSFLSTSELVVLCAPFDMKLDYDFSNKIVIDAGNNSVNDNSKLKFNYREIGKLTVNKLVDKYKDILEGE